MATAAGPVLDAADPGFRLFGRLIDNGSAPNSPTSSQPLMCDAVRSGEAATPAAAATGAENSAGRGAEECADGKGSHGEDDSESQDASAEREKQEQQEREEREGQPLQGEGGAELKRPTTPLPCPRCKSLATKFCYFNNYNPNQPRHFCRACQRYWTAGGNLRNVPVGSGRRKSKVSLHPQQQQGNQQPQPSPQPGQAPQDSTANISPATLLAAAAAAAAAATAIHSPAVAGTNPLMPVVANPFLSAIPRASHALAAALPAGYGLPPAALSPHAASAAAAFSSLHPSGAAFPQAEILPQAVPHTPRVSPRASPPPMWRRLPLRGPWRWRRARGSSRQGMSAASAGQEMVSSVAAAAAAAMAAQAASASGVHPSLLPFSQFQLQQFMHLQQQQQMQQQQQQLQQLQQLQQQAQAGAWPVSSLGSSLAAASLQSPFSPSPYSHLAHWPYPSPQAHWPGVASASASAFPDSAAFSAAAAAAAAAAASASNSGAGAGGAGGAGVGGGGGGGGGVGARISLVGPIKQQWRQQWRQHQQRRQQLQQRQHQLWEHRQWQHNPHLLR
ncbi:hypothetical protein CLOM_g21246 [Closterium sp. NIES-68]|nr:hypothetical protein CLOM_g21246 [Closterium sp. NIES-68]